MEFDLNVITEKIHKNEFASNFIEELGRTIKNNRNEDNNIDDIKLTDNEELEFEKREFNFLQEYFANEIDKLNNGEIFIVTNKYENDSEYNRYKIANYKDNLECKYIALEKELPENVKLRDIVRKIDGKYICDKKATEYVKESINKIKQEIIDRRM